MYIIGVYGWMIIHDFSDFCWLLLHWVQLLQSESTICSTGDDRCMCPISDVLGIPKRKSVKY